MSKRVYVFCHLYSGQDFHIIYRRRNFSSEGDHMFLSFKCHKAAGKFIIIAILAVLLAVAAAALTTGSETVSTAAEKSSETDSYITWAEFNVSFEALDRALNLDIKSQSTETPTDGSIYSPVPP